MKVRIRFCYFWHFLCKERGLCFSTHFPQEEWVRPIFDGRCPTRVRKSITVIFLRVFFCFGQRTVSNRKYCRLSLELALTTDCTNLWNDQRSHQLVSFHDSGFKFWDLNNLTYWKHSEMQIQIHPIVQVCDVCDEIWDVISLSHSMTQVFWEHHYKMQNNGSDSAFQSQKN